MRPQSLIVLSKLRQPKYSYLVAAMTITFLIHLCYWLLFPYEILVDRYTLVKTLWDSGWFETVGYEYSRLCVEHNVLPYTASLPEYVFNTLEYPFLAGYLFYAIYLFSRGSFAAYCTIFQFINIGFQVGIAGLVYMLSTHFHSMRRSFYRGLFYSMMPSILYFSMSRYDAIPTFFMLLSLYLFLIGKVRGSYVSLAVGTLLKVYPALLFLAYLRHGIINRRPRKFYVELVVIPLATAFVILSPLIILNPSVIMWLASFLGTFGWNWESIYGPIDQFLRPVFPNLAFIYVYPEFMRVVFAVACLSILVLEVKTDWQLVNGVGFSILSYLQTTWFFSPQYIVWISPILLVVSKSTPFLILYFITQVIMTLELPSPFYYLAPLPQFYYTLYVVSIRILIFSIFMIVLFARVEGRLIRQKILRFKEWWYRE